MKKILLAILTLICFSCIGFAAACTGEPEYFILDFESANGVEYVCEIPDGYEVKSGYEVSFTLVLADNAVGEPSVRANDTEIKADDNGVYKFVMTEQTTITVSNVYVLSPYDVTFDVGNNRVTYTDENGEPIETLTAQMGEVVKFKIKISVYHDIESNYEVSANSLILSPNDGLYSFTVTNDTTVTVNNLDIAKGFIEREGTGSGTKDDPYLISEPVDLYYMRELINDGFYSGRFGASHYKLMNDIDLEGEQLFVLGNGTVSGQLSQVSYFSGSFDGNGHTISNFYISETEQDTTGAVIPLSYIGMFGYVLANTESPVEIKDLTIKDFTMNVDGAKNGGSAFFAGGLIGYGTGVNITNCNVQGKITANGPEENFFGFVGGVAGYLTSAYGSEEIKYNSSIVSTTSDVEVTCSTGWIYAAGGIAGVLDSSDDKATSYILNSIAKNNVSGAIYTGGLVGNLGAYAAVKNSYFSGSYVEANSNIPDNANLTRYANSYGGGIAGYASYESVIADCFASGEIDAYAVAGTSFGHSGNIVGYSESAGVSLVEVSGAVQVNTYYNKASSTLNKTYALNTLNWIESDWDFTGSLPVPSGAPKGSFTLTVDCGNSTKPVTLTGNLNMAQLYETGTLDMFIQNGNLLSYGYYFDTDLTQKVPFGYVPSGNVTLYVGFADYNEVAGKYYIRGGNGAYLSLESDGTLLYREGALNHVSYYLYDGSKIILVESALFEVIETQNVSGFTTNSSIYFSAIGTVGSDGSLSMYNIASGYTGTYVAELSHYYTASNPLSAVPEIENFVYGTYYDAAGVQYTFYEDGTGLFNNNFFTYSVSGNTVTTDIASMSIGLLADGVVVSLGTNNLTKYDAFRGVWEKSATSHMQYTFDGMGGYTYEYFKYVSSDDGVTTETITKTTGTYTISEGVMLLDSGEQVSFTQDGYLSVKYSNYTETYYMQSSFAGEWNYFNTNEVISLKFNGIGNKGYGTGLITYGADAYIAEINYEAYTTTDGNDTYTDLLIYNEDSLIGMLRYTVEDNTLRGSMYSLYYGSTRSGMIFCLYDDYKGKWISEEFGIVEFNGLGYYNLGGGNTGIIRTRGEIIIEGSFAGYYTLEGYNLNGTFDYNGKTYAIEFDQATKSIKVTEGDDEFSIIGMDAYYGITYVSANGDKYVFNGGGYLLNGGKLNKNGEFAYIYTIDADGNVAICDKDSGEQIGSFAVDNSANVYVLTLGGERVTLTYDNVFTGGWAIGGATNGVLVIGTIGADATAKGSYFGVDVTFNYDVENNALSFVYENKTLNVYYYSTKDVTELLVGESTSDVNSVICISSDRVSAVKGEYTTSDNKKLYLDGMDTSVFGKSVAILYNGDSAEQYTYRLDGKNIILTGSETLILKAVPSSTQGAYINGDKAYALQTPDELFDVRVWSSDSTTIYRFDGAGTVTATKNGQITEYTYVINSYDGITNAYDITLTDSDGKTYSAVYNMINLVVTENN